MVDAEHPAVLECPRVAGVEGTGPGVLERTATVVAQWMGVAMSDPEPEPEPGTGAAEPDPDDPFTADPNDPFGVFEPEEDPGDPGTLMVGIPQPPDPPALRDPPAPRPGQAELDAAWQRIPAYWDPTLGTSPPNNLVAVQGKAKAGRDSFADLWHLCSSSAIDAAMRAVKDTDDQSRLEDFNRALASCDLKAALDEWCTIRNSPDPDLTRLAELVDTINDKTSGFIAFADLSPHSLTGIDVHIDSLGLVAKGIVRVVASEADTIVKGARVPAVGHGEAICGQMENQTRDCNWRGKLESCPSWKTRGTKLQNALKMEVGSADAFDNDGRDKVLRALDAALKRRDRPPSGADMYQLRTSVLMAYTGAANAIHMDIAEVRARLHEVEQGATRKGWSREQCQQALDVLAGTMRVVRESLAADPLATDPDLAGSVRNLVTFCANAVDPTAQESLAAEAQTDFRKFWAEGRDAELKALKKLASSRKDKKLATRVRTLSDQFQKGFGPLLDKWSAQLEMFPDHKRSVMHDLALEIATTIYTYRKNVLTTVGEVEGAGVVARLDAVATGITANIRSYQGRGGLFG